MQVDFYILTTESQKALHQFLFKFVKKLYKANYSNILLYDDDPQRCQQIDRLLWADHATEFIPHVLLDEVSGKQYRSLPCYLTSDQAQLFDFNDILILLAGNKYVPTQYQRVIEITDQNSNHLNQARYKYHQYQKKDRKIRVHKMS